MRLTRKQSMVFSIVGTLGVYFGNMGGHLWNARGISARLGECRSFLQDGRKSYDTYRMALELDRKYAELEDNVERAELWGDIGEGLGLTREQLEFFVDGYESTQTTVGLLEDMKKDELRKAFLFF